MINKVGVNTLYLLPFATACQWNSLPVLKSCDFSQGFGDVEGPVTGGDSCVYPRKHADSLNKY